MFVTMAVRVESMWVSVRAVSLRPPCSPRVARAVMLLLKSLRYTPAPLFLMDWTLTCSFTS